MRIMGIEAIYPKRRLSIPRKDHKVYPYLLKGLEIDRPDQVWAIDITYIRLHSGFCYLVAIIDWHSRFVISWELSSNMEVGFCIDALENALNRSRPEIFNSDQGSQFTCEDFTDILKKSDVRISMDGRGRCFDNIMVERLWRTVKYEDVYIKDYGDFRTAFSSLKDYFSFYNNERKHKSLNGATPIEIYEGRKKIA